MMCGHSRTRNITSGCKFTLLSSPPDQVVKALKPIPSDTIHFLKGDGDEDPRKVPKRTRTKDHIETNGLNDQISTYRSGDPPLTSRPIKESSLLAMAGLCL